MIFGKNNYFNFSIIFNLKTCLLYSKKYGNVNKMHQVKPGKGAGIWWVMEPHYSRLVRGQHCSGVCPFVKRKEKKFKTMTRRQLAGGVVEVARPHAEEDLVFTDGILRRHAGRKDHQQVLEGHGREWVQLLGADTGSTVVKQGSGREY